MCICIFLGICSSICWRHTVVIQLIPMSLRFQHCLINPYLPMLLPVNLNFNGTHQAGSGFIEQQWVLVQNFGGHREVCRTHCGKVGPAVGSLDVSVAVIRRENSVSKYMHFFQAGGTSWGQGNKMPGDSLEVEKHVWGIICEVLGEVSTEQVVHASQLWTICKATEWY